MGYASVRGGEQAIRAAEALELDAVAGSGLTEEAVERGLPYAVDRVMAEAGLFAPGLAAQAVVESQGDLTEAAFLLRSYRSTLPRVGTASGEPRLMRVIRRLSPTFKDVPGGQVLGPTRDYAQRVLGLCPRGAAEAQTGEAAEGGGDGTLPKVADLLRSTREPTSAAGGEPLDITRQALRAPASRAGRLQTLARAEPGALAAFAYTMERNYGMTHPTILELRVGELPLVAAHPRTGEPVPIGDLRCTEVEVVDRGAGDAFLAVGYGLVVGRNEVKAISMALLDLALDAAKTRASGPDGPAEDEELVLLHVDGVDASGMIAHLKLPHYVTFQAARELLEADA